MIPWLDEATRRSLDVVASLLGLLLLSPLLLLVGLLVRLTSPGPALFSQERVGRGGRTFRILKFRSMRPSAEGPLVTSSGDSRVTPIGRLLRKTKMDELPQLINVLLGQMSLVGPRPEVPHYVKLYNERQRAVLAARPGITGPCQIEYCDEEAVLAAAPDPEAAYRDKVLPAKLEIDLRYLQRRTVLTDLGILYRTFLRLVRR
ncbi:MAG TPA: sugar transferase [Armatimonadota bacterium]